VNPALLARGRRPLQETSDRVTPPSVPLYQSDFAQTPLPEILVKIQRYNVGGVIDCQREDVNKKVFLDNGQISWASSSDMNDSLGMKLLREGRITQQQYEESARLIRESGKRQGKILVDLNAIEPASLFLVIREQVQEIVWSLFTWDSGIVSFAPGPAKKLEFVKLEIPIPRAIIQGIRRMTDVRSLVARVGTRATLIERNLEENSTALNLRLKPEEQHLLDSIRGKMTLQQVVNTPPLTPSENAKLVYAFHALQLITTRTPRAVRIQVKTDNIE
jgi:hypothetical protein